MVEVIKGHLPQPVRKFVGRIFNALSKPELPYLELHLTDHCNLNCKGCGHFCPIAPPSYADLKLFEQDMRRLRGLFCNISTIRLMGGEPLLHPQAASFIEITRIFFPLAEIKFVTNGILLPGAPDVFWTICRDTHTTIDWTIYPPLRTRVEELRSLCASRNVCLNHCYVELFQAGMNLLGNSDESLAFSKCRSVYYCPFLQNGHLYPCSQPALVHYFNKRFNYNIPTDGGIDIHSHSLSGRKVLQLLSRPVPACKYCSYDYVSFPWVKSSLMLEEWVAGAQPNLVGKATELDEKTS